MTPNSSKYSSFLFHLLVPPFQEVIGADAVLVTQLCIGELAISQHPVCSRRVPVDYAQKVGWEIYSDSMDRLHRPGRQKAGLIST